MASTTCSIPQILKSPLSLLYPSQSLFLRKTKPYSFQSQRNKQISLTIVNAQSNAGNEEDVVIVGAGIAGLATAVALHRCCQINPQL